MKLSKVKQRLSYILEDFVSDKEKHAKWLNTLSMMEFSGAKKIYNCAFLNKGNLSHLEHGADEANHALILKKKACSLNPSISSYGSRSILGGNLSKRYLHLIDLKISRFLRQSGLSVKDRSYHSYLLTTYAIEVRAQYLYPLYESILKKSFDQHKISILKIIEDEKNHLSDIKSAIKNCFENADDLMEKARHIEEELFKLWLDTLNELFIV